MTVDRRGHWLTTGGRYGAGPFLATALLALGMAALPAAAAAQVTVREADGRYHVTARFVVPQASAVVEDVLTDYENIPRFMPDVRSSRIVERRPGGVIVEQDAVARALFFSKRIHLRLDVSVAPGRIEFRDISGDSFHHYEGAWTIDQRTADAVVITYELVAQPAFSVPEFMLTRLLRRDADQMIERLADEIAARVSPQRAGPMVSASGCGAAFRSSQSSNSRRLACARPIEVSAAP